MAAKKKVHEKSPDTMIGCVEGINVVYTLARGKVSKVTLGLNGGGNVDVPASLVRSLADAIDDVDGAR